MIGKQLGHYEIVRKIGAGGMGEVYVANDTKLHREVALKLLPEALADNPDRLERFAREAKTVAALNHPNIVTIYSVEEAEGVQFMTMELIRGETLDELIPESGMPVRQFLENAVPLADAIAAAPAKGVQHRDLKPPNVMVDENGRLKVLDFGLAKQRDSSGPEGLTQMLTSELTGEGKIIGTVAYMSPEQAEGKSLDHRSDIFSLGILMYEMITGQRPFAGDTNLSILSSILKDDPSSVSDVRDSIPIPIARLIQRTLAKQPGQRYQSAADLRQDLTDIRRDMDTGEALSSGLYSGSHLAPGLRAPKPWLRWAGYAAGVVAIVGLTIVLLPMIAGPPRQRPEAPAVLAVNDFRPSVAVFYFDNISNDEELQWLRTGLTDMLVTDLSQTAEIRVLATDRLYSMLMDIGEDQAPMTSFDVVQRVTDRAQMNTAIVGSYARAGDELRINVRIQDPRSGDVIASNSVQGNAGEVFDLVDEITDWVQTRFRVDASDASVATATGIDVGAPAPVAGVDNAPIVVVMENRALGDVTTKDIDAYRMYAEGVKLNLESKEELAIPLLEAAVELDPDFAMAHAKLSVAYGNMQDTEKAELYARKAFEKSDRLPPRERFYIRGRYLSMNPETVGDSIEEYSRAVEMFPDHMSARHNLATQLMELERYDEALPHLEELQTLGMGFAPSFQQLALAYAVKGEHDDAVEVLRGFVETNPDNGAGYRHLAEALTRAGDYDGALEALDKAYELAPNPEYMGYRWNVYALDEHWDDATAVTDALVAGGGREVFGGHMKRAIQALYFGLTSEARAEVLMARDLMPAGGGQWMWAMSTLADTYDLEDDLDGMSRVLAETRELGYNERTAQQIEIGEALVMAKAGDLEGATAAVQRFEATVANLPLPPRMRTRIDSQVEGLMALARRDVDSSIRNLRGALEANPRRDISEEAVQTRFFLGESLWQADRHDEAVDLFRAIERTRLARVNQPQHWVRSFWYLGTYHADRGENVDAERYFSKFLEYWGDGELDRDKVATAQDFLNR